MQVTSEHLDHWREHGYALVPELLGREEVAAARRDVDALLAGLTIEARNDGVSDEFRFPFAYSALNRMVEHPQVLSFVEQAIGTSDIRLTTSVFWPKHGGAADYHQGLHLDYGDLNLVVPRDDGDYVQMTCAVYYTDVTADNGPTHILSKRYTRDVPLYPMSLKQGVRPELYEHEEAIVAPAGSLLVWDTRTWHRGSAFRSPTGYRYAQFTTYGAARHPWMSDTLQIAPAQGGRDGLRRFLEEATPRGRELIGFPAVGDPYWTEETIDGVSQLHPGIDMTPYREALLAAA
jgi:Phytanoyl-CoA dioxygenase (PhyH)